MKDELKKALLEGRDIITGAESFEENEQGLSVIKSAFSGNMKLKLDTKKDTLVLEELPGKLPSWNLDESGDAVVGASEKEDDLAGASLVFVGGRGLGSKENYLRLKALAKRCGAACGCSRPAAINGWESYSRVVGISGARLKADICVTFGVSGAGPMLWGLENVKKLIAVNSDEKAQIFKYADEGIVEDCLKLLSEMEK